MSDKRHLAIVYRGTGGIIGQDYVSLICQAATDLVIEENPTWPATMGGLPVGAAGSISDPSMNQAVATGLAAGKAMFQKYYAANPLIKTAIIGYSAGAVVAAQLRQWLQQTYPDNYLCSISLGDPTRPAGGQYYPGTSPTVGRGISSFHYGDITDWRHCWLAAPGDMYTSVPDNAVGDIMQTAYDMVTNAEMSDPLGTAQEIISRIPQITRQSGVALPDAFNALLGGLPRMGAYGIGIAMQTIQGFLTLETNPSQAQPSLAAAAEAAVIALQFVGAQPPTAPHIEYQIREVWPGQTYLGLGIQHLRDWASRVQPT